MSLNILKIALIMPKLTVTQRRFTQALVAFLLLASLSSCDLPNNQNEAEANTNQASSASNSPNNTSHLLLGTGSVQGVYFPIGGVICRLLNRHKNLHKIRCSLESTGGSIYNLKELSDGNFDLVFAQSDWQFHAYHGTSAFEKQGANKNLRAVFALEADPLAIIVRDDSDINSFDELADHRVSFGYTRSLQHRIVDDLLEAKGWIFKGPSLASSLLSRSGNVSTSPSLIFSLL